MGFKLMIKYIYSFKGYNSLEEAESAAADMKNIFDNNPNKYSSVKQLVGSEESGWIIPTEVLSDEEILNASTTGRYLVSNYASGNTNLGADYTTLQEALASARTEFAHHFEVNKIYKIEVGEGEQPTRTLLETLTPQSVDMSVYM